MTIVVNGVGGVVLCGGRSSRMGRPKLALAFGRELLLQRVCRLLGKVVEPIVVVAAEDQELPELPPGVSVARDEYPDLGPLAGIATGLGALRRRVNRAYVTSCDAPLLKPEFVLEMIRRAAGAEVAVPFDGDYDHVLAGVYQTTLESTARALLDTGQRRPLRLIESCDAVRVPVEELRTVDPELDSLRNANTLQEYQRLLVIAGLDDEAV